MFVAGKIGHPNQPEFGIGALAEEEAPVLDEPVLSRSMLGRPRGPQLTTSGHHPLRRACLRAVHLGSTVRIVADRA